MQYRHKGKDKVAITCVARNVGSVWYAKVLPGFAPVTGAAGDVGHWHFQYFCLLCLYFCRCALWIYNVYYQYEKGKPTGMHMIVSFIHVFNYTLRLSISVPIRGFLWKIINCATAKPETQACMHECTYTHKSKTIQKLFYESCGSTPGWARFHFAMHGLLTRHALSVWTAAEMVFIWKKKFSWFWKRIYFRRLGRLGYIK